jgi:hypothetical protein
MTTPTRSVPPEGVVDSFLFGDDETHVVAMRDKATVAAKLLASRLESLLTILP